MLQKIRSQIILTILISIVALTCKGYAEVSLDILKPTENEKISLPSVSVKGKVTPPEKLVGKIKWETTVEGNKSIQETDSEQEGAIVVAPFPIHNSSFGPNTVIAKAKIDVTPPLLEVKDSEGKVIPDGGLTNKTSISIFVDDYADGSGIDRLEVRQGGPTGSILFSDDTDYGQSHNYSVSNLPEGTIYVKAIDIMGNYTLHHFIIDVTPPSISVPSGDLPFGFFIPVTVTDNYGIKTINIIGDDGYPKTYTDTTVVKLDDVDFGGKGIATFIAEDEAGNVATPITRNIVMPVATLVSGSAYALQYGQVWVHVVGGGADFLAMRHIYLTPQSIYAKYWFLIGTDSWQETYTDRYFTGSSSFVIEGNFPVSPKLTFSWSHEGDGMPFPPSLSVSASDKTVKVGPGTVNPYSLLSIQPNQMTNITLKWATKVEGLISHMDEIDGTVINNYVKFGEEDRPHLHVTVVGIAFNAPDIPYSQSSSEGGLKDPRGGGPGSIYVADAGNNCIKKYSPDLHYINTLDKYNGEAFNFPSGVCTDEDRNIYVADTNNGDIKIFDSNYLKNG